MVFQTQIQSQSASFQSRKKAMTDKIAVLKALLDEVQAKGWDFKHPSLQKHGKFPVRKRIQKLLDPSSCFLEFSPLAGHKLYDFKTPAGGLITGIGSVLGRECMIIANDPTVKGGAYLPITVKKHLRAQEIALENHLPCFYLVDSGGAFLPKQAEVFPDAGNFGSFFYNQAQMSGKGIEQISIVFGLCTAGGAYIPALSDETIMVEGQSSIFLGGPPLVFAATGEKISSEDLGGSHIHSTQSGVADYTAETEEQAIEQARNIFKSCKKPPPSFEHSSSSHSVQEPLYNPEEIYGLLPEDLKAPIDMREILARIVDASAWEEFKPRYAPSLFTAWSQIGGFTVGILANQGILFGECALKAVHFIDLCDRRKIPLIFFQNTAGFMVGKKYESQGIAKHGAKMVQAVSLARVPLFTVIVGASYGAGNYGMCGRAFHPRQLWIWPSGKIGVMGSETVKIVLSSIGKKNMKPEDQIKIMEQYETESSPYFSTARLWDDGLIDPLETRKVLILGLRSASNRPFSKRIKPVYRM